MNFELVFFVDFMSFFLGPFRWSIKYLFILPKPSNTYCFVFRWYLAMSKISIELIVISRQICMRSIYIFMLKTPQK